MDEQFFIDRLLENENLTDNLEDADAKTLIKWAIQQIGAMIANPLMAGEKLNGLMAILKRINKLVPQVAAKSVDDIMADLGEIASHAEQVFDRMPPVAPPDLQALATSLQSKSPGEAIQAILEWITKEQTQ